MHYADSTLGMTACGKMLPHYLLDERDAPQLPGSEMWESGPITLAVNCQECLRRLPATLRARRVRHGFPFVRNDAENALGALHRLSRLGAHRPGL